jgi:hypothetical protein
MPRGVNYCWPPPCLESGSHRSLWIFRFMGLLLPQIRGIGVLGRLMNIMERRWFGSEIGGLCRTNQSSTQMPVFS